MYKDLKFIQLFLAIVIILTFQLNVFAQNNAQKGAAQGAGTGALLGALAGVVFGDGDVIGDAVSGAFIGGGVGAIAGGLEGGRMDREQEQYFNELVNAFGEDNLRGYIELLKCNHDKAIALFKVEQVSSNKEHSLTGFWLEAAAEKDRKNNEKVQTMYPELIKLDGDIDDEDMAKLAVNQLILDLRSDRKANQLPSCSN